MKAELIGVMVYGACLLMAGGLILAFGWALLKAAQ